MRMKEVCDRTGLTDRAVRLYIDSGLLSPEKEINYTGRRAIYFKEADVMRLEAIATLRKAGFAISDIKNMIDTPSDIPDIISSHRITVENEIAEKKSILELLSVTDNMKLGNIMEVAEILRNETKPKTLPKEDFFMNFKEIKQTLRGRIPSLAALIFMIIGVIYLIFLADKTAFYDILIKMGGGYDLIFNLRYDIPTIILIFVPGIMLIAAVIFDFIHIINGSRLLLVFALCSCILSALVLLILPAEITQRMFVFEFYTYRYSLMHKIYFETSASFDLFIKALKFMPCLISAVFIAVGIIREKKIIEK